MLITAWERTHMPRKTTTQCLSVQNINRYKFAVDIRVNFTSCILEKLLYSTNLILENQFYEYQFKYFTYVQIHFHAPNSDILFK